MRKSARPIMIQGTSSHVGKSIITAALCRIFSDMGMRVAPFKAQNMSLNSFVTPAGGEIGRAQAFQADSARIEPSVDMNPILLKPAGDKRAQVIIHGRVHSVMSAKGFHAFKKKAMRYVLESYSRLASAYDVIVIEGAGSPAEVNLRTNDIANMGIAEAVKSPVLLVGDIDRGGVFASIVGTMTLLTTSEKRLVKGFLINKFRGDITLLKPGLDFLTERTKRPVLGVLPYIKDVMLPDEDGVSLDASKKKTGKKGVRIAVIRLPRISNFTDFDALINTAGIDVDFIERPEEIQGADIVIIPGTKNTIEDMLWMNGRGISTAIKSYAAKGGRVAGICGGMQMLGKTIRDPHRVESRLRSIEGLGLLEMRTTLMKRKATFQVAAKSLYAREGFDVKGYEIHMGQSDCSVRPFARITRRNGKEVSVDDGAISDNGLVWGTYIHGIFDNDAFRRRIIKDIGNGRVRSARGAKGFDEMKEDALTTLAGCVKRSSNISAIMKITGI